MNGTHRFVGIYRKRPPAKDPDEGYERLFRQRVGPPIFRDEQFCLFSTEPLESQPPASLLTGEGVTVLSGEPLLVDPDGRASSRTLALAELANSLGSDSLSILSRAHGAFCGAHFSRESRSLYLFSDKIGLRGLYMAQIGSTLLFSDNFNLLREAISSESEIDELGTAESVAFGYPLGDRTTLLECKRLLEAEIVKHTPTSQHRSQYFKWCSRIDQDASIECAADRIYEALKVAVSTRLQHHPQEMQFAFLSGGMDSRLIVHLLKVLGRSPVTLNVAPTATQDAIFGQLAADFFSTNHHSMPTSGASLGEGIVQGVNAIESIYSGFDATRWWSGDGGSVGLGHVYLTEETCSETSASPEELARKLIKHNNWRIGTRALKRQWRYISELPEKGLIEELVRLQDFPPEKRAFAFLLFNDQRRHLDSHHESPDDCRYELATPFYDDRFLQVIFETPSRYLLNHKLYNLIYQRHLPSGHAVPWQAYPGHEPCPHVSRKAGRYQWDNWAEEKHLRQEQKEVACRAASLLARGSIGSRFSRSVLLGASILTYLGIKDMRYVLNTALAFSSPMRPQ